MIIYSKYRTSLCIELNLGLQNLGLGVKEEEGKGNILEEFLLFLLILT